VGRLSDGAGSESSKPVNIRDVALRAGVSTATVSRALATPERVRAALRSRVEAAVRELEYTPNLAARTLRAGASRMILIDAPHRIGGSFFAGLLTSLDEAFTAHGYTCIVGSTEQSDEKARRLIELAYARQIDGAVVLTGMATRIDGRSLVEANIPIVSICAELKGARSPCVVVDDEFWAVRQVELLVALGHRRLLYVGGVEGNYNEVRRRRGFKRAARAARLAARDLSFASGDYSLDSGVEAGRAFAAVFPRPSGVVCASDDMALGFMGFAAAAGLKCPEDYSIVGFDGIDYGRNWTPSLATIAQPRGEMGRVGADLMLRALGGAPLPPDTKIVLDCSLQLGGSTAPPRVTGAPRRRAPRRLT